MQHSYDVYLKARDASYLFDEPVPYSAAKSNISDNMTPHKPFSGYHNSSKQDDGKHTLSGRVNALSAQLLRS